MIIRSSKNGGNEKRQLVQLFFYFILVVASTVSLEQLVDSDSVIDYRISYVDQNFLEDDADSDGADDALIISALSAFVGVGLAASPNFIVAFKTPVVKNYFIRAPPISLVESFS